jgi:hypothetical protein
MTITPDSIQKYLNHIHTNLQLIPTHEDKAQINFLDLLITRKNNTKWATFTLHSPKVRKITNFFKHNNLKIAFKSNNTIPQLIRSTNEDDTQIFNNSGVYKLTCKQAYVGQTSRNLKQHYQEHIRYIKNNNPQSAFAQHIK